MPTVSLPPPQVYTPAHPRWPRSLLDLRAVPEELHVAGTLPELAGAVAIVGTRAADVRARRFARRLAYDLAAAGRVVISGGAHGVDSAAHEGALEAGGVTLAVIANYFDAPYPSGNRDLFARVAASGALLTEAKGPRPPRAPYFLQRNRIIAALAEVTVVVQAPLRSGALSTAAHARRLGRPVLAVPAAPWDPRGAGTLALLKGGAGICVGSPDVLTLGPPGAAPGGTRASASGKKPKRDHELDSDQRAALEALREEPRDPDQVCEITGLSPERVHRALLMLLLSNAIEDAGSGRYVTAD